MKIFFIDKPDKKGIQALFEGVLPRGLEDLANLADDDERPLDGVEQFFGPESHPGIRLRWVGVRTNEAGRLLGAVVKIKGKGRYFFALDYTPDHHYEDTFVKKTELLPGLRASILAYVHSMAFGVEAGSGGASGHGRFEAAAVTYHKRRYVRLDKKQLELTRMGMSEGVVCFSPPGVGKTLIAVERAKAYFAAGLRVAFVLPTQALADDVRGELLAQEIDLSDTGSMVCSLDEHLSYMSGFYPELGPAYDAATDRRELVDEAFFRGWMTSNVRKGELPNLNYSIYWQEFCEVFMRPNWRQAEQAHRDEEGYVNTLGTSQSFIEKDQRAKVYGIFARFFALISDNKAFYFRLLRAQQLYSRQVSDAASPKFDAVVIDEIQRFKPWEWASILMLLEGGLYEGQYLLFGDAYQGGSLWLAQVLKMYFLHYGIPELPLRDLLVNHRNAQAVSQFVQLIHRTEESILGAMEKDTHTRDASLSDNKEPGQVIVTPYDREQIKADADAYVVIPDESCRAAAELLWSRGQIVSLLEFTGLSAKTVVMYGFSVHYKTPLKAIHATAEALPPEVFLGEGTFSRKSKGDEKPLLRACMQAMYTAASRAEMTLILDEPAGTRIHPFFIKTLERATPVEVSPAMPMAGAGAGGVAMAGAGGPGGGASAAAAKPYAPKLPSKPMDWFLRVENDFNNNLIKQAEDTLREAATWGDARLHARILSLIGDAPLSNKILKEIRAILEAQERLASAVEVSIERETGKTLEPVMAEVKSDLLNKEELDNVRGLVAALTTDKIRQLFKSKQDNDELKRFLFHNGPDDEACFLVLLCLHNKLEAFCRCLSLEQFQTMQRAYALIPSPGILLRLCWANLHEMWFLNYPGLRKKNKPKKNLVANFNQLISDVSLDVGLFRQLLDSPGGDVWLHKFWDRFKKTFNFKLLATDFGQGMTLFVIFARLPLFGLIVKNYWHDFEVSKSYWLKELCTFVTAEGFGQGTSPFYWFTATKSGCETLREHWDDFREQLSPAALFQVCRGAGPNQGASPFFQLSGFKPGRDLLRAHWGDFAKHITPANLFQVCTGVSHEQGTSPFYWLAESRDGRQFLRDHWSDFGKHLSSDGLFRPCTGGDGRHGGKNPFSLLVATPCGRSILREHWTDFERHFTYEGIQKIYQSIMISTNEVPATLEDMKYSLSLHLELVDKPGATHRFFRWGGAPAPAPAPAPGVGGSDATPSDSELRPA